MLLIPKRHGQTDRRTDGRTTYCRITALTLASRGNKRKQMTEGSLFNFKYRNYRKYLGVYISAGKAFVTLCARMIMLE